MNCSFYIHKDYFLEFEEGRHTTIDISNSKVKFTLGKRDNLFGYEQVFAYSFGPFNPQLYFSSSMKIVFLDWEPYMLKGDLTKFRAKDIPQLGKRDQAKEFPTYEKLEAYTHIKAVDFSKLLLSKFSIELSEDEVMQNHMCILEHNFFPALALAGNTRSTKKYINTFSSWNSNLLLQSLKFYTGNIVIGTREYLNYLCSYNGLFKVAFSEDKTVPEGESTSYLLAEGKYPTATIIGRKVIRSWFNYKLGGIGATALLDETGCLWIGYVHLMSRRKDQWSQEDQDELASWIYRILSGL